jgi:hypothetical protein
MPAALLLSRGPWHSHRPAAHHHRWCPSRPPGGIVRLVDDGGRQVSQLCPAQIVRVQVVGYPNVDQCVVPDCPFGPEGLATECEGPRVLEYSDGDAGGRFGRRDGPGPFVPLRPDDVARITHYRAPVHGGIAGVFARFDDVGWTTDPESRRIATFDDPPTPSRPWRFMVVAPTRLVHR